MRIFGVSLVMIVILVTIGIAIEQKFPANPIGSLTGKLTAGL